MGTLGFFFGFLGFLGALGLCIICTTRNAHSTILSNILPLSMRRSIGIVSLFTFLAAPLSALALAGSPAALLSQMSFRGNPHAMEAEFHMHYEDTHISVWMKGAQEGKTPAMSKAWEDFTIDIASDGHFMRAKGAVRMAHGAAYIKLLSVEGNAQMDISELRMWTDKPWVKISIPEEAMDQPSFASGLAAGMRATGSAIEETDVRTLLDTLADALFTMESERFQGGVAYSLRLAPDALHRAVQAVQASAIGKELEFDADTMSLPENLPVNLHIRVNTNSFGELVFAKWYAATEKEGMSLVMQGNTQWQGHPVYVEIPKKTISWEEFSEGMDLHMLGQGLPSMPSDDRDEWQEEKNEWMKDEEEDDDQWEESSEDVLPLRALPRRDRSVERTPQRENCTAAPGTPEFLQQARKGSCNLTTRSEYRINDISSTKALNPRKTRLKNPYIRK